MISLLNSDAWFLITVMDRRESLILSTKLCSESYIPTQLMEYAEMMLHPEFRGASMETSNLIVFIEKVVTPRLIVESRCKN